MQLIFNQSISAIDNISNLLKDALLFATISLMLINQQHMMVSPNFSLISFLLTLGDTIPYSISSFVFESD